MSITNPYPNPPTNIMNRGLVGSPVKSVGIQDFSPGWEKLIKSEEKKINNYLTYAKLGSIEGMN